MNTKAVRENFSYKMFHGDKETFWLAMELSGAPYAFESRYVGSIGVVNSEQDLDLKVEEAVLCGKHILHLDPTGRVPFWINGGIYVDKTNPGSGYANFTHYWAGVGGGRESKPQWWWTTGNVACLREKGIETLSKEMVRIVTRIHEEAFSVDDEIRSVIKKPAF